MSVYSLSEHAIMRVAVKFCIVNCVSTLTLALKLYNKLGSSFVCRTEMRNLGVFSLHKLLSACLSVSVGIFTKVVVYLY